MENTQNSRTIQEIRQLLDQLEANGEHVKPEKFECLNENFAEKLLYMSCDRFWIYDPATSAVEIHVPNPDPGKPQKVVRSLSAMLARVDPQNRKKVLSILTNLMNKTSSRESFEYFDTGKDGSIGYSVTACYCEKENHLRVIGISRIISQTQQSITAILQAQQKFELLMGLSTMLIWEYDVKKKLFHANPSLSEKLGIEHRQYSLEELSSILQIDELSKLLNCLDPKTLDEKAILHVKTLNSDTTFIFESAFKPILDPYGEYALMLGTMRDITENQMLKTMASRDNLTGCYNRNMADVTLKSSFQAFKEKHESYTIIFFDVDKFKSINDRYGHDMGDHVLKGICGKIAKEIRSDDMMFRWGGDEFLLICKGIAKENIYGYIDRLRKNIEFSTFELGDSKLRATISIGAAIFYGGDIDYNDAMKRADRSLYKAKLAGCNKVAILK